MPKMPTAAARPDENRRRILAAVKAIAAGEVAGYGEVARRAGLPGRARLVARILSAAIAFTAARMRRRFSSGRAAAVGIFGIGGLG